MKLCNRKYQGQPAPGGQMNLLMPGMRALASSMHSKGLESLGITLYRKSFMTHVAGAERSNKLRKVMLLDIIYIISDISSKG